MAMPYLSEPQSRDHALDATTLQLRALLGGCAACRQSLDGHTYRFFSCHPDLATPASNQFKAAMQAGDWATVHSMQIPSVNHSSFVVYAVACPGQAGGTAVALFRDESVTRLHHQQAISATDFAALRALCPTCQWITFTPVPSSPKETV